MNTADIEMANRTPDKTSSEALPDEQCSTEKGELEVLSLEDIDPALSKKMHLVNNAINEIGWTAYHWKLFVLNGFGYSVDSQILILQSIVQPQILKEMPNYFRYALTIALYVGLLIGAIFWGLTADMIGRRFAFNLSLLFCAVFAIAAGGARSFVAEASMVALSAFGAGGNLVLDTTVFLEFLPGDKQWLMTTLAAWWGLGQTIAALTAWPFMANYACEEAISCTYENNKGWRYVWYVNGALVLLMSIARLTIIRLKETPKWLLVQGRDEDVVKNLSDIAKDAGKTCSLTVEMLKNCGEVVSGKADQKGRGKVVQWSSEVIVHLKGLFPNKRTGWNTTLIWTSWTLIGLAYPLFNVFLPIYLATAGAHFGDGSVYQTYRDYAIANVVSIFGPILAGYLCNLPRLGRRGTMVIGALVTMVFMFAYTEVRTPAQNLAFVCMCNFWLNVYYGTLYGYTPECLPSAHRATGTGLAVALNRIMGIVSAIVATYANTATSVPIYICAGLYLALAGVSAVLPMEPRGMRSA